MCKRIEYHCLYSSQLHLEKNGYVSYLYINITNSLDVMQKLQSFGIEKCLFIYILKFKRRKRISEMQNELRLLYWAFHSRNEHQKCLLSFYQKVPRELFAKLWQYGIWMDRVSSVIGSKQGVCPMWCQSRSKEDE